MPESRIIVALDYSNETDAWHLINKLEPQLCRLKVGKELFTIAGPRFVEKLVSTGYDVFLDLKFHDIPNTVAQACKAAAGLGVWMLNVHALGGRKMMLAARDAIQTTSTKLIAVTLLTSLDKEDLAEIGLPGQPADIVQRLAHLAYDCGMDGVVCSAQEAVQLRQTLGHSFCLVTPGIRPADAHSGDQKRITTPAQAIINGAHYLVIGRPITQAQDPVLTCERLNTEIANLQS